MKKKLKAAHHKFKRILLGITWRDDVRNDDIRKKTGLRTLENTSVKKEDGNGWDT